MLRGHRWLLRLTGKVSAGYLDLHDVEQVVAQRSNCWAGPALYNTIVTLYGT